MELELDILLDEALASGDLLESSHENIHELLDGSNDPVCEASVRELAEVEDWKRLNDRFFRHLAFGTGGLRGLTIDDPPTDAERGKAGEGERPDRPCVGTNALNEFNISRATLGLVRYILNAGDRGRKPSLVLARDTRHFGKEFAGIVTKVATENGCDVYIFPEPRSTPQLSFAVRHLNASAGLVLTASHNPPQDNGFKAYWSDGAQVVDPHASGIIAEVNALASAFYDPVEEEEPGRTIELGEDIDEAYMARLETLLLDPDLVKRQSSLKIVFTNLHGTGGTIAPKLLRRLGFRCDTVPEQDSEDGWFPTVDSPNPENAAALEMGIAQAKRDGADILMATDPDGDRMGVAVRNAGGEMELLTGNQIGSLLAWYRIKTFCEQGVITDANRERTVLIKTFVTTELQTAIARKWGIPCVNTLTGFKYIGEKLGKYEAAIPQKLRAGYREKTDAETRALRLEHSRFFVFGGEESYGYLGADFVRDKDANGSAAMFAELAAYAKSQGVTVPELMDRLYCEFGYYLEGQQAEKLTGADGAIRIQTLARDYSENPPTRVDGAAVSRVRDFATEDILDEEGDPIPKEKMIFVDLADGRAFAVRPSGTEPKIKFYLYVRPKPGADPAIDPAELPTAKKAGAAALESLRRWILADMKKRLAAFDEG